MTEDLQRLRDLVGAAFMVLPPAVVVAVVAGLLVLGLWAARNAVRSLLTARAVRHAPLVHLGSTARGLVKLRGTAHRPTGSAPSPIVWYTRTRRSGSDRSTLTTTDNFLIRDPHGACAVNTVAATLIGSETSHREGFLDDSRSTSEKLLRAGDAVFALGELRRDLPPLAGVADVPCQLARCRGVLLVSGGSERHATVLFWLWFIVQAPAAALCLGLAAFGGAAHVLSYPPQGDGPAARFVEALRATPWKPEAGPDHPLWRELADPPAVPADRAD